MTRERRADRASAAKGSAPSRLRQVRRAGGEAIVSLVRLPPSPSSRLPMALRSAVSLGVPLAVLTALGLPELGLQAAAGAFTAFFGGTANAREQLKILPIVAIGMLLCASAGALLAPWLWAFTIGLVGVTVLAAGLAFAFRLGPPGPVFFVLAYGLAASITGLDDGVRRNDPWLFLAAFAGGSAFAVLVACAPLILPRHRREPARPLRKLLPGPWLGAGERLSLARVAVVAVLGSATSLIWLDTTHPYWTVASGVAVIGLVTSRTASISRALHRVVGTVVGVLLFLLLAPLGANPVLLVLTLVLLQFAIELVVVRNYALAFVFVTPLVLFINSAAVGSGHVLDVAVERVIDTAVGSGIALATAVMGVRGAARDRDRGRSSGGAADPAP